MKIKLYECSCIFILNCRNSSLFLPDITAFIIPVNLTMDIGNTHSKIACFDQGKITDSIRIGNPDHTGIVQWIMKREYDSAIYCSFGRIGETIRAALNKQSHQVLSLDQQTPLPFRVVYKTPDTLGYDRIAAASGAVKAFPGQNVLILDFGTAITIDILSSTGAYLGGNISPGLNIRFRSLHDYTSGLPLVEKDRNHPFFGDGTESAIIAGVQQGIVFEISGYIEACKKRYTDCKFVATGGDAGFITSMLTEPVILYPDLIMEGLNYILDFNTISNRIS